MAASFGELITTTLRERTRLRADAITRNNGLLYELRQRRRVRTLDGGREITMPILYGENATAGYYQGDEQLSHEDAEATISAAYDWKQWGVGVKATGLLVRIQNNGRNAVIDIMATRIEKAEKSLANLMAQGVYADGTGASGKEIGGIGLLNSANETSGVVGGIDKASATWWRNKVKATGGVTSTTIYANMLDLKMKTTRGTDKINLIVADDTYYQAFALSLRADQRLMNPRLAAAGFESIQFMEVPVIADGLEGGFAPVGMHFLKLDTIEMKMHSRTNNVPLPGAARRPIDRDVEYVFIAGAGNMVSDDIRRNGRMVN